MSLQVAAAQALHSGVDSGVDSGSDAGLGSGLDLVCEPAFKLRLADLEVALPTQADKPNETATATLCALWHLASGRALSVHAAQQTTLTPLEPDDLVRLDALIAQRLQGAPLAHLTGRQHFMGLEMLTGPSALIPRVETEQLGRAALALLGKLKDPVVLDLCCGSGNLALALAHHVPQARVWAGDVCAEALGLARRNAQHLGLSQRVEFRLGDLFEPFREPGINGQIDLLVCNPPYISSAKIDTLPAEIKQHEPHIAFDGGPLGVNILRRVLREAPRFLSPGGWLAIEVGRGQGQSVLQSLRSQTGAAGFESPTGASDAQGDIRVVVARRAQYRLSLRV